VKGYVKVAQNPTMDSLTQNNIYRVYRKLSGG